jgi:pyrroline-5-carboxylate reductase
MEPLKIERLAVLGAGKMGETLIRALLSTEALPPERIVATARHQNRLNRLTEELGIETTLDNRRAVADADVILLCVKPQGAAALLAQLDAVLRPEQLLVSIFAGVTSQMMEEQLSAPMPVVRVMPNTPSLVGAGMTALCRGSHATEEHLELASGIFERVGRTVVLDEVYFDAVTSLSASGVAFLYIVIEAMAEGGVKVGLPRSVATELAAQACLGAGRMVLETGQHPALLKDSVTTPAGCTVDGILSLEEGGLRVTLIKAIVEATRRAKELVD